MSRFLGAALVLAVLGACRSDEPIEPPQPLYGEDPIEYPLTLWDQGVEGETVVRVHVTDRGVADSAEVQTSSGVPALDSAALLGILETRFRPARQGERRIDAWVSVPIEFSQRPQPPRPGGA